MKINIKRLDKSIALPQYQTNGAVAFDLSAREDLFIPSKEIKLVPTGLVVCVPAGYMLMLAARSSLPLKKGLMLPNSIGVIDQDYCGPEDELKIQLYNFTDQAVEIKKGERLAQGIVVKIEKAEWAETEDLENNNRGGFGSTG